jgi:nitrite reductase/ring-hydroxylating ferredoxin subunit
MARHVICPADEIRDGEKRIVDAEGLSIGIFNLQGEYYALNNACPHQLAPLCEGRVTGTTSSDAVGEYNWTKEGEIIRCPWHNWEFDIKTGESVFNPHVRTRTYEVDVERPDTVSEGCEDGSCADLAGDSPPVDTYTVETEDEMVVLYI